MRSLGTTTNIAIASDKQHRFGRNGIDIFTPPLNDRRKLLQKTKPSMASSVTLCRLSFGVISQTTSILVVYLRQFFNNLQLWVKYALLTVVLKHKNTYTT